MHFRVFVPLVSIAAEAAEAAKISRKLLNSGGEAIKVSKIKPFNIKKSSERSSHLAKKSFSRSTYPAQMTAAATKQLLLLYAKAKVLVSALWRSHLACTASSALFIRHILPWLNYSILMNQIRYIQWRIHSLLYFSVVYSLALISNARNVLSVADWFPLLHRSVIYYSPGLNFNSFIDYLLPLGPARSLIRSRGEGVCVYPFWTPPPNNKTIDDEIRRIDGIDKDSVYDTRYEPTSLSAVISKCAITRKLYYYR